MLKDRMDKGGDTAATRDPVGGSAPALSLPKGGGAVRSIGEKFAASPVTGTGSLSVPVYTSPGRSQFSPQLTLSYDSGAGNGPFGFGWRLSVPQISRKTDKGLPKYIDEEESDVFIFSETEDLVPVLKRTPGDDWDWETLQFPPQNPTHTIYRYRPRTEGLFARIERWHHNETGQAHWKAVTSDNVVSLYGQSPASRIADPDDPTRIFTWLLDATYDDKGNAVFYEYKAEDRSNVAEELHELGRKITANRYLKRITYGNQSPYFPRDDPTPPLQWHFTVVLDYGEHDAQLPLVDESVAWPAREDSFSSYRAGFEVRTHRLCRRVLMFHQFAELGSEPCLVRSTDFTYEEGLVASYLRAVTQTGYIRNSVDGTYVIEDAQTGVQLSPKPLPPLEFAYTKVEIDETVRSLDPASLEQLPVGLDESDYRWVDLDGEGLSGFLTQQTNAWYYKRNLSPLPPLGAPPDVPLRTARFAPAEVVGSQPSLAALSGGQQQLLDLAGDGRIDLVQLERPLPGFYERTDASVWENFRSFTSHPNIDWDDPNLRFVDLSGDGHADVLIAGDEVFTWFPSLGEEGFGPSSITPAPSDADGSHRLVFADGTQSVYLSDMSGDGLSDLMRIRNGDVSYWPNLGYGRFGTKVTMGDAPVFDHPDLFDQKRIRLADIDGSGNTDIIYLGRDAVRIFFNRSGNSWSTAAELKQFPPVDNLASVTAADLLGNGTACLVWSSPLPSNARAPMRYVDLMGGTKPHLLVGVKNNLGAETLVRYAPSTRSYLEDRAAGLPWITRLPFVVHVVEQVEVFDHVSQTKLVTRYQYHHGYFDGPEREFRGFGKVEQWDTQSFSRYSGAGLFTELPATAGEEFHLPPVRTVSWFHNGAFIDQGNISRQYETEYYSGDIDGGLLPDTTLPDGLNARETREACRALKGRLLRQEVYADDGGDRSQHPYSVAEHAYKLRLLQPSANNRHAVFYTYECESLSYQYERDPSDPRVAHQLTLEVDDFGNVTKSAAVAYPRRLMLERRPEQERTYVTYTENGVVNMPDEFAWHRVGLPVETGTYEITGLNPGAGGLFTAEDVGAAVEAAEEIEYEVGATEGATQKRLIEHLRTLYRRNDLSGPCEFGEAESRALPFESYKLAFTPGLVAEVYGNRVGDALLGGDEARYVHIEGDVNWWISSGQSFYSPDQSHDPAQELAFARDHFFLPHRFRDPFGNVASILYDDHQLLLTETRDPLGNVASAVNHYRTLAPQLMTDPNGNRAAVRFDAIGMVTATFTMGKPGRDEGDRFDETSTEISPADDPTTHLEYDTFNWVNTRRPNFVHTFARERHGAANPRWQESYSYSDGLGREIEKKIQAEPGLAPARGASGELVRDDAGELVLAQVSSRWVGSGRTVFDNKGNPVKKYEPFFDSTHAFVDEEELVEFGVTPILRYDPLGRLIRTDLPDGTFSRVAFDPWQQATFDTNDTVLESRWYLERGSPDTTAPEPSDQEARAAWLAAKHAGTPTVAHFDSLGRIFLTVVDNGPADDGSLRRFETRVELDIEGNQRSVTDALGRQVVQYDYDMLGVAIHQLSMDAGERWTLANVAGKSIRRWDSRAQLFSSRYDALQRPTHLFVRIGDETPALIERTVYGESHPDSNPPAPSLPAPCELNLRGKVFMSLDQAGVLTSGAQNAETNQPEAYDFKGNLLHGVRQFAREYKQAIDWSEFDALLSPMPGEVLQLDAIANALGPSLEPETFVQSSTFDALNRPLTLTAPDDSVIHPVFNEANLLERVSANLRGAAESTEFVAGIDYDAKGQRQEIVYGNSVASAYDYDPFTFRLTRLRTMRGQTPLQDLSYTYDAAGNVTAISDAAQQTIFFDNEVVGASSLYTYDSLYRLTRAEGREHAGQNAAPRVDHDDSPRIGLPHPSDGQAMRRYVEEYEYDEVGNILAMIHRAGGGDWTRRYEYAADSNRLLRTSLPGDAEAGPFSGVYEYDAHGNMTRMPHLSTMRWDSEDQLASTERQVLNIGTPETTYYVYNAAGERVRKVTEREAAPGATPALKNERLYLGGFEVYREYDGGGSTISLERETLHVMDDKRRVAVVDTKTVDASQPNASTETLTRFQFDNHLGSASLELDGAGAVISYEEYHPYGSTSYQAGRNAAEVSLKRYRYTGQERDEETGLYYHVARYYVPWLGRWTAADPVGLADGVNRYAYARGEPIGKVDPRGTSPIPSVAHTPKRDDVSQPIAAGGLAAQRGQVAGASTAPSPRTGVTTVEDALVRQGETTVEHVRPESGPSLGQRIYDAGETLSLMGGPSPMTEIDELAAASGDTGKALVGVFQGLADVAKGLTDAANPSPINATSGVLKHVGLALHGYEKGGGGAVGVLNAFNETANPVWGLVTIAEAGVKAIDEGNVQAQGKVGGTLVGTLILTVVGAKAAPKRPTGTYTNLHESGRVYHGKGPRERSQASGRRIAEEWDDPHIATDWTRADTPDQAFFDEALRIAEEPNNYNRIASPGVRKDPPLFRLFTE